MTMMSEPHSALLPHLSSVMATTASTMISSDRGTTRMQVGDGDTGVLSTHGNGTDLVMQTLRIGSAA
jgi:hypothetical protein